MEWVHLRLDSVRSLWRRGSYLLCVKLAWLSRCMTYRLLAGVIVFGSLMAVIFVGQQFMQDVLGYSTLAAGASTLPAAIAMVIVAPQSAKLMESHGSRFTLLVGYVFILGGLVLAWATWREDVPYWLVAISYVLLGVGVGVGVGFAGTPASRSLTGSVPVDRAGMASGRRICSVIWVEPSCSRLWGRYSPRVMHRRCPRRSPTRRRRERSARTLSRY